MQFHAQQNDYNQFAAAAAAAAAYTPNVYYEQQQAMMPPHDALLYDLHDTYAQHLPASDQMIIPPPSSTTTTTTTMIPRAGASATNTSSSNNRKRPKRKQVKNACVNCQKACKKCDDGRPCQRCIKLGLTATCTNSPRKERKKGVKRGPYKKRQQQQQQQRSSGKHMEHCYIKKNPTNTLLSSLASNVANKKAVAEQTTWDDTNLAALSYNNGPSDNIVYPQRIITPPLTQQESPVTSSPLSADAGYGYATTTTAVECDGSCSSSSPLSPNFPINAWDDPLFGLVPTEMAEPIMVQDLASVPPVITPQYPPAFDDGSAAVSHDVMTKTQQQYYYPVAEEQPMCTSCIPQQSFDMAYNGNHYHHMYNQQHYMQQQQQQQQQQQPHNGYWQTFLTNA
ncbi:hypothetical protein RO3G_04517 [Lichtheimia corymbifera JMRC:FSU:9682]|uniref:Zn(2)-C6 fungal-type domain-containing protein n=1 Tax=Lichtheimia corymbifera JMRC:FSU:9682 TaxID=1263082 RepID=A0A068S1U0_9FUNG|nr:hypothetical protein RO3G_04517 [Lichtheimia corymbifera JMRC:FSU:9682]